MLEATALPQQPPFLPKIVLVIFQFLQGQIKVCISMIFGYTSCYIKALNYNLRWKVMAAIIILSRRNAYSDYNCHRGDRIWYHSTNWPRGIDGPHPHSFHHPLFQTISDGGHKKVVDLPIIESHATVSITPLSSDHCDQMSCSIKPDQIQQKFHPWISNVEEYEEHWCYCVNVPNTIILRYILCIAFLLGRNSS